MSEIKNPFALRSSWGRLGLALPLGLAIACASAAPPPARTVAEPAVEQAARRTVALSQEQAGRLVVQVPNPVEVAAFLDAYARGPYLGEVAAVYARAQSILKQKAPSAESNAAEKMAVVLDIDETSLSNLDFYRRNGFVGLEEGPCDFEKGPCSVREWFKKPNGVAIAPALEFVRAARRAQVAVFFITGRREKTRATTEENLRQAGYEWQQLLMKPDDFPPGSAAQFKAPARQKLTEEGWRILINVGDQESDLTGGYAENPLKLPNPFYYIP